MKTDRAPSLRTELLCAVVGKWTLLRDSYPQVCSGLDGRASVHYAHFFAAHGMHVGVKVKLIDPCYEARRRARILTRDRSIAVPFAPIVVSITDDPAHTHSRRLSVFEFVSRCVSVCVCKRLSAWGPVSVYRCVCVDLCEQ